MAWPSKYCCEPRLARRQRVKYALRDRDAVYGYEPAGQLRTAYAIPILYMPVLMITNVVAFYASVQTTEHYLGCEQKLRHAVNDSLGPEGV